MLQQLIGIVLLAFIAGYILGQIKGMIRAIKWIVDPRRERGPFRHGKWMIGVMEQHAIKVWGGPHSQQGGG